MNDFGEVADSQSLPLCPERADTLLKVLEDAGIT